MEEAKEKLRKAEASGAEKRGLLLLQQAVSMTHPREHVMIMLLKRLEAFAGFFRNLENWQGRVLGDPLTA